MAYIYRAVIYNCLQSQAAMETIKLLVDKKTNSVLFAEVNKEVVDFLFSLLSLPLGSVIKLLGKNNMEGGLGNLYESVETMNETYILPNQNKDSLLNPSSSFAAANFPCLMPNEAVLEKQYYRCGRHFNRYCDEYFTDGTGVSCPGCKCPFSVKLSFIPSGNDKGVAIYKYYGCHSRYYSDCNKYFTDGTGVDCPGCKNTLSAKLSFIPSGNDKVVAIYKEGFVKGVGTYMVMDDLTVSPMSTISSITLLNKFGVDNLTSLEEKIVDFGIEKGLEVLKASWHSKKVLSTVFLAKKDSY